MEVRTERIRHKYVQRDGKLPHSEKKLKSVKDGVESTTYVYVVRIPGRDRRMRQKHL